jgi:hypothetical protein
MQRVIRGLLKAVRSSREKKQQVPPLRYAPVGMTILLWCQRILHDEKHYFLANALSSRPERSAVEGPAVSFLPANS